MSLRRMVYLPSRVISVPFRFSGIELVLKTDVLLLQPNSAVRFPEGVNRRDAQRCTLHSYNKHMLNLFINELNPLQQSSQLGLVMC